MLLTTCTAYPSTTVLSTVWISLDWLIQAWGTGTFDAEPAGTVPALPGVEQIAIRLTGFGKATGESVDMKSPGGKETAAGGKKRATR
ncbi:MAG TPA: hypothetical protein VIX20_13765 [Ktedonobacteraceae bacterium]